MDKCPHQMPVVAVRESEIDRCLDTLIPGGSVADDWFMPHANKRARENIREVVRRMIGPIVSEREFYRKHADEWERTGMNALAAVANLRERLRDALEAIEVLASSPPNTVEKEVEQ